MRLVLNCLMLLGYFVLPAAAAAADLSERCAEDQLSSVQEMTGRNVWALACHLISKMDYDCAMVNGYYWTFNSTHGGANVAPIVPGQACDGYRKFVMCPAGCYESAQRLRFGHTYVTPAQAWAGGITRISALAPEATLAAPATYETDIQSFVHGREQRELVRVETTDFAIEVTRNHPLVRLSGAIVPASEVRVGDALLGHDGRAQQVSRLRLLRYDGEVWNVRPRSSNVLDNIFVAEGLLSGSSRFQNEWASDTGRLLLRQTFGDASLE